MLLGYIITIFVLCLVTSHFFKKLAVSKGYQARLAARYPWLIGGCSALVSLLLLTVVIVLGSMLPQFQSALSVILMIANWFIIAVFLAILNYAYNEMKAAPNLVDQSSKINQGGN